MRSSKEEYNEGDGGPDHDRAPGEFRIGRKFTCDGRISTGHSWQWLCGLYEGKETSEGKRTNGGRLK